VTPTASAGPMVLSGSISNKPRGSVTVQAYVGAQPTLCQGASVTLKGDSSSFSNLSNFWELCRAEQPRHTDRCRTAVVVAILWI
jgi:hypothetical protein